MKTFCIVGVLAVLCGCVQHVGTRSTAALTGPVDQAGAISIAKQVVAERENWRRVDCDARRIEQGWKIFVCRKPIKIHDPVVNMTIDESGHLTSYEKYLNLK